jgi:hypothetical protein
MNVSRIRSLRFRRVLAGVCSSTALTVGLAGAAAAQESAAPAAVPAPSASVDSGTSGAATAGANDPNLIIVIGDRSIVASLKDVPVERTYDEDGIASYDVSTVGELLGEIRGENGDSDPAFLINGQPVVDVGNISDIPVEAISRIETLPRGAAQRVNGVAGQRAYNIVLRKSLRSLTATASREVATEGGWANNKGEALLTRIEGQNRIGLTLRAARSGALFESERDFVPRVLTTPYSPIGNILAVSGGEVDPLLSALAGVPVTSIALPAGNAFPTLAALLPGANLTNPSDDAAFRSLRGTSRPVDLALSGSRELNSWLTLQFNGRLGWTDNDSFNGLPSARFLIPATNPFSPFSVPVYVALNDPGRGLTSSSKGTSQSISSALNANVGEWRGTLSGRWDRRRQHYDSQFTGSLGAQGTVNAAINPFHGTLAALIPVSVRTSRSTNNLGQLGVDAEGPLFAAWAGPVRGRVGAGASWVDYEADDSSGSRSFNRHEYLAKAGVTLPLTSRDANVLPWLGDSSIALDIGRSGLGRFGTLTKRSASFEWRMVEWLQFVASSVRDERAIIPELLAAPQVISVNVPYFDPLTGQTSDVTTISGGAAGLRNEESRTRTLSLSATPLRKYSLQLDADYVVTQLRNQIGALPLPSAAVVAAFPDRFQRDSSGTLILVDNRTVNFALQSARQIRLSARFVVPLTTPRKPIKGSTARRAPPLKLQVNASHIVVLKSTTVIRDGLPEVDLLEGGAIGIGGGVQRHVTNGSVALTRGKSGIRSRPAVAAAIRW